MISLSEYIEEGLLNGFEKIKASLVPEEEIRQFIKDNYTTSGRLKISKEPDENGEYEVNSDGDVHIKMDITSLTNGMFKWGVIKKSFDCSWCESLTSLKGAPKVVGGDFDCNNCDSLTSLEGAPKEVGQNFDCSCCNSLVSLEGGPKKIGRSFICSYCKSLTSLKGAPEKVGKDFFCSYCNSLTNLEGAPKKCRGGFDCHGCSKQFTIDDVKKVCNVDEDYIVVDSM